MSIFFGSQIAYFGAAAGEAWIFTPSCVRLPCGEEEIAKCLEASRKKKDPVEGILAQDAIPLAEPIIDCKLKDGLENWPLWLRTPLLKTKEGGVKGIACGIRSGLICDSEKGKWYRLKGCGNNSDGFLVRPVLDSNGKPLEVEGKVLEQIRGSAYEHTVTTELVMTNRINGLLEASLKTRCANKPLGWFEYCTPDLPWPSIKRCCIVFETCGDRRVADHVLRGLEMLLSKMVDTKAETPIVFPDSCFGARPAIPGVFDEMDQTPMVVTCGGFQDCPLSFLNNIANMRLPMLRIPKSDDCPQSTYQALWDQCCSELNDDGLQGDTEHTFGSLLGYLYWRIGWECGRFLRVIHQNGISWGTYRDWTGTHCNAHGNNMVLLTPEISQQISSFVAPLDFDMAYDITMSTLSETEAKEQLTAETAAMLLDLGGSQNSTGTKQDHDIPTDLHPLKWALRDTLVGAAISGLHEYDDQAPFDPARHQTAYALLQMALIETAEVIA